MTQRSTNGQGADFQHHLAGPSALKTCFSIMKKVAFCGKARFYCNIFSGHLKCHIMSACKVSFMCTSFFCSIHISNPSRSLVRLSNNEGDHWIGWVLQGWLALIYWRVMAIACSVNTMQRVVWTGQRRTGWSSFTTNYRSSKFITEQRDFLMTHIPAHTGKHRKRIQYKHAC